MSLIGIKLSLIAGLTTLSGLLFIKFNKNINKLINISLSMTFIVLILISIFDIFLEAIKLLQNKSFLDVFIYILINYTIIKIILKISSKNDKNLIGEGKLKKIGIINAITLLIHNIPEGFITCITASYDIKLGFKIALSIIIHNIPEGISIALPIYYGSNKNFKKTFIYVLISAIAEPFGACIAYLFFKNIIISNILIGYILITVAIIMISISIEEIFPKIKEGSFKEKIEGFLIGSALFLINLLF